MCFWQGDTIDAIVQAKATVNQVAVAAQQAMYNQPCTLSQIQEREADIRALAELSRALDKKVMILQIHTFLFQFPIVKTSTMSWFYLGNMTLKCAILIFSRRHST